MTDRTASSSAWIAAAEAFELTTELPPDARLRRVRIVRDYGMFDRREAPEYFPEVSRIEA